VARILLVSMLGFTSLAACSGDGGSEEAERDPTPTTAKRTSPAGPFTSLRWAGGVKAGELVYDNGRALWAVDSQNGATRKVWEHPEVAVSDLAVAPGGAKVAMTVDLPAQHGSDNSSVLYLLHSDHRIETVDVLKGFTYAVDPVFLRPAAGDDDRVALYWIRSHDGISRTTGRFDRTVMRRNHDRSISVVHAPLRHGEAIDRIDAYPGGRRFTVTLGRTSDEPTRFEVLANDDTAGNTNLANPVFWSQFESRANTEASLPVVWISPVDYLVFNQKESPPSFTLDWHLGGCEGMLRGPRGVFDATGIDDGTELAWEPVALPPDGALVLTRDDAAVAGTEAVDQSAIEVTWSKLSTKTGRLERTPIRWQPGPWAWVADNAGATTDPFPDCDTEQS
jgi:hypothetical protein